uniref:Uncharacterized protein n=1 Tax=Globisporangium ultimum (strain ATCC 200006 / CBS 805.95 / DAOM BR144) TaxID=431595 RepID=K3WZT4_GLOUD
MDGLLDERLLSGASPAGVSARLAPGSIRSLILEKEKELHDINEYRIRTLEALLRDKESAANGYKQKFTKLQEDFKYNLKLLEGRDEELALYDTNFANIKSVLRDREAEISEAKAQIADLHVDLKQEQTRCQDQEIYFQQKLKDARAQMEGARWQFDDELRRQKDEMEQIKRKMDRRMREQEEDLEAQRREISVTFDEMMRQRESEFKQMLDQVQSKNRDLELKLKATQRDSDANKDRLDETKIKMENMQQLLQENEKELKAMEWQLSDVRSAKDAKINELEDEIAKLQDVKQALLDEYEGKMAELLQSLHSVEKAFVQQKKQYDEELQHRMRRKDEEFQAHTLRLEEKIASLTTKLREQEERYEQVQAELKQTKWDGDDKLLEKDRDVERLKSEMQDIEDQKQAIATDFKQQLWNSERENLTLQEKLKDLQLQIQMHKEKEKVHRQELLDSMEKQEDLKREVVTLNLRWENKWQDQEQEMKGRSELRIRELQQMKERLLTEKQATEERLVHAENELQRLRSEIYSLKSNARIAESFDSQYYGAKKPSMQDQRGSLDGLTPLERANLHGSVNRMSAAASPLWSEDNGELSPITGMSPLLTETPSKSDIGDRRRSVGADTVSEKGSSQEALQLENAKLRDLIRQMKEALAEQASDTLRTASSDDTGSTTLLADLKESQKRCVLLEAKLLQLEALQKPENDTNLITAISEVSAQLALCKAELQDANRMIEAKNAKIEELEASIAQFSNEKSPTGLSSDRVIVDAQLSDLNRKLASADADIQRLVKERSQLMELSNQLRADLRRLKEGGGSDNLQPKDFAGKKDYENLVAELSRSLEEARLHNKTLKKELRRMVKLQVLNNGEAGTQANEDGMPRRNPSTTSSAATETTLDGETRRRSSTLSMMKTLDDEMGARSKRSSLAESIDSPGGDNGQFDVELLSLVRKRVPNGAEKRSSGRNSLSSISTTQQLRSKSASRPKSIPEKDDEDDSDVEDGQGDNANPSHRNRRTTGASSQHTDTTEVPKSTLSSLFHRDRLDSLTSLEDANTTTAKVSDARLRLQQDIL